MEIDQQNFEFFQGFLKKLRVIIWKKISDIFYQTAWD